MIPGGAAAVHTRKPIRTGKTTARHCLTLRVESRHITDVTLDDLINHGQPPQVWTSRSHTFTTCSSLWPSSFKTAPTVVVGGEVKWGVVAPPSDLEGQDYVGCSRAVIYSTLPSTGLSGYPVGSAPSLLLVFWHLSKWFSVSVNTELVNGEAGTGLHRHVQQRTHRQQRTKPVSS